MTGVVGKKNIRQHMISRNWISAVMGYIIIIQYIVFINGK